MYSAHLLRESEGEEGIVQPWMDPPTKKSLASEMPKAAAERRATQRRSNEEDEEDMGAPSC